MSDTKKCAYCGSALVRSADDKHNHWSLKRYCSRTCTNKAWWCRNKPVSRPVVEPTGRRPVTEQEAVRFVDLVKSGMRPVPAAKQLGRTNYYSLKNKALLMGLLKPAPFKAVAAPVDAAPKPKRIEPLPKGSALTWGEMMPDISWAEAERMTAHMGAY